MWGDLTALLTQSKSQPTRKHFFGPIVLVVEGRRKDGSIESYQVVDGQQRLTTILILLAVVSVKFGQFKEAQEQYLLLEGDQQLLRLKLGERDNRAFTALMQDGKPRYGGNVTKVYERFMTLIEGRVYRDYNEAAWTQAIERLVSVSIEMSEESEDAQQIFESLNHKGRGLTQADLVRNYLFMLVRPAQREIFFKQTWRPLETKLEELGGEPNARKDALQTFIRDYLTAMLGAAPLRSKIYSAFRSSYEQRNLGPERLDPKTLVEDMEKYAKQYMLLERLHILPESSVGEALRSLGVLGPFKAYPLLMQLLLDTEEGPLDEKGLVECMEIIESYIFRRIAVEAPFGRFGRNFAAMAKALRRKEVREGDSRFYVDDLKAQFLALQKTSKFPDDRTFKDRLATRQWQKNSITRYMLATLEKHGRWNHQVGGDLTIEHVMPEKLTAEWEEDLGGKDAADITHGDLLGVLGNLSLTQLNSPLSNHTFSFKRRIAAMAQTGVTRLDQTLRQYDQWTVAEIKDRGVMLAKEASRRWPLPLLDDATMKQHGKGLKEGVDFSHHLKEKPVETQTAYRQLHNHILKRDPGINIVDKDDKCEYRSPGIGTIVRLSLDRSGVGVLFFLHDKQRFDDPARRLTIQQNGTQAKLRSVSSDQELAIAEHFIDQALDYHAQQHGGPQSDM